MEDGGDCSRYSWVDEELNNGWIIFTLVLLALSFLQQISLNVSFIYFLFFSRWALIVGSPSAPPSDGGTSAGINDYKIFHFPLFFLRMKSSDSESRLEQQVTCPWHSRHDHMTSPPFPLSLSLSLFFTNLSTNSSIPRKCKIPHAIKYFRSVS